MSALGVEIAGIHLRNPLILASGIWGESGVSLAGAHRHGAGAVVTKSIGEAARPGYPNPTVETYEKWGFLNAMGLPNPGIDDYPTEIAEATGAGATVIGSIFAGDADGFATLGRRMATTGVVALELNLSCPHAKGLGSEVGSTPSAVESITRAVVDAQPLPVIAKLTPNTHDIGALAEGAERGGAAAVSAINTVRGLSIDRRLHRPTLSHGLGGLSGPAIRPVGLACVYQIYERTKLPIIGIGGISTAEDVVDYVLAGARAVQIGTAVSFDGIGVFDRIEKALPTLLHDLGYPRLADAVGAAHATDGGAGSHGRGASRGGRS